MPRHLAKITQLSSTGGHSTGCSCHPVEEMGAARDFGIKIKVRIAVAGTSEPVGKRNPPIFPTCFFFLFVFWVAIPLFIWKRRDFGERRGTVKPWCGTPRNVEIVVRR